jgi:hypothetical protein
MTNSMPPFPCGCLDRCRQEGYEAYQSMAQATVSGAYCKKRRGESFRHRLMSEMELRQLEVAERQDELAAKELSIAQSKLREAEVRREFAAEVLNHWLTFTAPQTETAGEPRG